MEGGEEGVAAGDCWVVGEAAGGGGGVGVWEEFDGGER